MATTAKKGRAVQPTPPTTMIDFHTHILPGIDDGSRSTDESIQMLRAMPEVTHVVATPHFYAWENTPERFLRRRTAAWEQLRERLDDTAPDIRLGAEVCYFEGICRSDELHSLCIEGTNMLLLEMPFEKWSSRALHDLLELGHRHVAYIAPPLTVRQKQRSKRVEGFLKEFKDAGLGENVIIKAANEQIDKDIPGIDSEYRIGYDLTKELLAEHRNLTAIVGLNDMIAFGIMDALYDEKYRVPGDMSVMGCDNTLFARMHNISLTTIEHFVIYKGRDACDIIMKKIKTRDRQYSEMEPVSIYHVEYEPRIVTRGTTSYPPSRKKKN